MDETVKNPGNMKPRRVAMLDMAEKEGKKKVSGVTMEKDIQGCKDVVFHEVSLEMCSFCSTF